MYLDAYTQLSRADSVPAIPNSRPRKKANAISFENVLSDKQAAFEKHQMVSIALDQQSLRTLSFVGTRKSGNNHVKKMSNDLGSLSTQFESGQARIKAIGYDKVGGTSYGKYQIASKVGTFDDFVKFLDKKAPDIAEKLNAAGPANTGSKTGAMVDAWLEIANTDAKRFEELQDEFIMNSHYEPAMQNISKKLDFKASKALEELVFSTAVQHGAKGASNIFEQAIAKQTGEKLDEKQLISDVYDLRKTRFSSSTKQVQVAVENRLIAEENLTLSMLA